MKQRFLSLLAVSVLAIAVAGCSSVPNTANYAAFGDPVDLVEPVSLSDAIAAVDANGPQEVIVDAKIAEVCVKMGCWMILEDGAQRARVRFTAGETCSAGYFVPRNAQGHRTFVKGTLEAAEIPEDWARHYAEDQGTPAEEIAKIIGPQKEYVLVARGVMISDADDLDPTADMTEE